VSSQMGVNELPELIYLDHQATTPVDPAVLAAMLPYLGGRFGNASSAHLAGQMAADAVRAGRDQVAAMIDGRPQSVIFTSGSTEANNLALGGLFAASTGRRHLVTVATEHPSVLEPAHRWERSGGRVTVLAVDAQGRIDLEELREAMSEDTLVVSVMAANNEIGTLAPVAEIAEIAHAAGALYHCDATQAIGRIPATSIC
jgi:cysteine desulfurase